MFHEDVHPVLLLLGKPNIAVHVISPVTQVTPVTQRVDTRTCHIALAVQVHAMQ